MRLPPVAPSGEQPQPPSGALHPVESQPRIAERASEWETPGWHTPAEPALARGVAPHEDVCWPPIVAASAERESTPREPAEPPAAPPDAEPTGTAAWETPVSLLAHLDDLAARDSTAAWAAESARLVRRLGVSAAEDPAEASSIIDRLDGLVRDVSPLAAEQDDGWLAQELHRNGHALKRRLDLWRQVVAIETSDTSAAGVPQIDPERLAQCLAEIDAATRFSAEGEAWRRFLLIDALREWSHGRKPGDERLLRTLARRVLRRILHTPLSAPQRRFIAGGAVAKLRAELRRLAAEPVDSPLLLAHLERYEQSRLGSDAEQLAVDCGNLRVSQSVGLRDLGEHLESHYRNANLRIVISGELLNRLVPQPDPQYARVHERVLGVPTRGRSLTSSDMLLRLIPDGGRVRMALEVTGRIEASTSSISGPVTFYNDSESAYIAQKPIEVDLEGIHVGPTRVDVLNESRLRGVETDFDGIPLVGPLVKDVARSRHDQKKAAARREVEYKVSRRAKQRIDAEADSRLAEVSETLQQRILEPLQSLSLDPAVIDAHTTEKRVTMRLRLAGEDQLGSHTPRPQAFSDSLASSQVHETAVNNVLRRLQLEGHTFTLPELTRHIAARLHFEETWETDPANEDVSIVFAAKDALGVRLHDGRIALRMAIAKLSKGTRRWRDFQVTVFYRPWTQGRSIELLRDGVIHLTGRRLTAGSQIALRGIFSRTFQQHRPLNVTPRDLENDPRLAGLAFTQLSIEDGWMGIALGPGEETRSASLGP